MNRRWIWILTGALIGWLVGVTMAGLGILIRQDLERADADPRR